MPGSSRRDFLAHCLLAGAALLAPARPAAATLVTARVRLPHPTPRPGITGAKVLSREQLGDHAQLAPLFDSVRAIPQVVDGIACNCGCAELPGFYSLLSCYEGDGMAQHCDICQGQARLAVRLQREGKSLRQIRTAIDAKYG